MNTLFEIIIYIYYSLILALVLLCIWLAFKKRRRNRDKINNLVLDDYRLRRI